MGVQKQTKHYHWYEHEADALHDDMKPPCCQIHAQLLM